MAIIITYDIPSKHVDFKKAMFLKGYKEQISGVNCKTIIFPNTTLYHASKTAGQAREDAKAVSKQLSVDLERCIATIWDDWAAICGDPFN